jgi:hypothetical protein
MGAGGVQRLLHRPWARALAIVGVYLLALQSAGLPLLTMDAPAACCCGHKDSHCRCKVCTHAREVESGSPTLRTCGPTGAAAIAVTMDPAFPVDAAEPTSTPIAAPADLPVQASPPDPARDVPTPPPLART